MTEIENPQPTEEQIAASNANNAEGAAEEAKASPDRGDGKCAPDDPGRLFIGGLPKGSTEDELRAYFNNFGAVKEVEIKTDQNTGNQRGFGFVVLEDPTQAQNALNAYESHELKGKWIEVKAALNNGNLKNHPNAKGKGKGGVKADPDNARRCFLGGLPSGVTEETLKEYFEKFGAVDNIMLKQDMNGKPRGFGFVTFETDEGCTAAIAKYADHTIDGKWIEVKKAEQPKGVETVPKRVFVGGLPTNADDDMITQFMSQFGPVEEVQLKRDEEKKSRGFGFVTFADQASCDKAIENYDNNTMDGKWIEVKACQKQEDKSAKSKGKGWGQSDG